MGLIGLGDRFSGELALMTHAPIASPRVLLTGARAPVTLDLARHFARRGHEVYFADSVHLPLARFLVGLSEDLRSASACPRR